jgi:thiol-disulfide isomerase/thioredoxin
MKNLLGSVLLLVASSLPAPADENTAWESLQNEAARLTESLPEEDQEAGRKMLAARLGEQLGHFKQFLQDYPQSPNRWEARMAVMQIVNSLAMVQEREPDMTGQSAELESIADDQDAPENVRADAGLVLLQLASMDFDRKRSEQSARALSQAIEKFIETHPADARLPVLRMTKAQALEIYEPDRARAIFTDLTKDDDPELSGAAKAALEMMAMRDTPVDLTFTAVDGSNFDLTDLRGKVVLLDFWATWCPPCVEEVPELVAVYDKFREQGFEIVGISLDENKAAFDQFTAENKMTWPQFFDGKGWENELAKRFGIQSVPTMWLLDREGKLVDASPRGRLEEAVGAALAAQD